MYFYEKAQENPQGSVPSLAKKEKSYLIQDVIKPDFYFYVNLQNRKNTGREKKNCHKF